MDHSLTPHIGLKVDQECLPGGSLGNVTGFTGGLEGRMVDAEKVQAMGSHPDSTAMN